MPESSVPSVPVEWMSAVTVSENVPQAGMTAATTATAVMNRLVDGVRVLDGLHVVGHMDYHLVVAAEMFSAESEIRLDFVALRACYEIEVMM